MNSLDAPSQTELQLVEWMIWADGAGLPTITAVVT
jgi:hypothetical protein